jgi:hypothetical protein
MKPALESQATALAAEMGKLPLQLNSYNKDELISKLNNLGTLLNKVIINDPALNAKFANLYSQVLKQIEEKTTQVKSTSVVENTQNQTSENITNLVAQIIKDLLTDPDLASVFKAIEALTICGDVKDLPAKIRANLEKTDIKIIKKIDETCKKIDRTIRGYPIITYDEQEKLNKQCNDFDKFINFAIRVADINKKYENSVDRQQAYFKLASDLHRSTDIVTSKCVILSNATQVMLDRTLNSEVRLTR